MPTDNKKTPEQLAAEKVEAEKVAKKYAADLKKSQDTPVEKKTKANYVPKSGEEGYYHALLEKKSFNSKTGKRQSKPKVQIFDPKSWGIFERFSASHGYSVDILHDPTGDYPVAGVERAEKEAKEKAKKK